MPVVMRKALVLALALGCLACAPKRVPALVIEACRLSDPCNQCWVVLDDDFNYVGCACTAGACLSPER